jgi:hypothetical protein
VYSQNPADVRFNPKVTELLRGSEMTGCADSGHHPTCTINRERPTRLVDVRSRYET